MEEGCLVFAPHPILGPILGGYLSGKLREILGQNLDKFIG
jgi:hypothetical protein